MTEAEIIEKYGPFPKPLVCNGHGDYGPHIVTCKKCLAGVPHDDHRILTKTAFQKKILGYFEEAIVEYDRRNKDNDTNNETGS